MVDLAVVVATQAHRQAVQHPHLDKEIMVVQEKVLLVTLPQAVVAAHPRLVITEQALHQPLVKVEMEQRRPLRVLL
jgi:hypothetical protein